ncbi:type IV secretion protein IcmC [Legionella micdadei]|uniref:Component of the Dot/Icm secretion system n=1 Tax=Legionella micdadei TaxID=451 RepID=A0A098GH43_LEGMI|nr:type IV secretion protein IcmC [Legionella micdadei]ARG96827.1 type IV secretion protein IcmC [Legionella micdadei]ARG99560.1 type IV secretion protein IcmC [Legionella micdadei]KTD26503.1 IcmC (DotE) [Legionella micdadei]NSL17907.1 type IV secretion protein IcmC [Legionella micdadei]CEG61779.1 Component of the Dot/Icm secretion system [Legionella micdadei]
MSGGTGSWQSWLTSQVDILNNIANNLLPVERLITGAAYLIGLAFAFKAIYTLKAYGESRSMMSNSASIKEPIIYMVVAAIFIYFPTGLAIMLQTTFGSSSILQYAPVNSNNPGISALFGTGSVVGRPIAIIIQTIGLIAFVRGWILIARSASQGQPPGGTGKGLVHIFGGILAMNIVATLEIINNTLYGTT